MDAATIGTVGAGFFIAVWTLYNVFKDKWPQRLGSAGLKKHWIFRDLDYLLQHRIPRIKPGTASARKCTLLKQYLSCDFSALREVMEELTALEKKHDLTYDDVRVYYAEYQARAELKMKAAGIPQIFIDRVKDISSGHVEALFSISRRFFESDIIDSPKERLWSVFTVVMGVVDGMMVSAEQALVSMNGELERELERCK